MIDALDGVTEQYPYRRHAHEAEVQHYSRQQMGPCRKGSVDDEWYTEHIRDRPTFMSYAPIVFVSALKASDATGCIR